MHPSGKKVTQENDGQSMVGNRDAVTNYEKSYMNQSFDHRDKISATQTSKQWISGSECKKNKVQPWDQDHLTFRINLHNVW